MAGAEKKYEAYRKVIDPLLETSAELQNHRVGKRVGNKIQIQTDVSALKNPGKDVKLRIVLVEETIKFVGSNKLRFHHQVVRTMPGGAGGVALTQPNISTTNNGY